MNYHKYEKYLTENKNCIICGEKAEKIWAQNGKFRAVKCPKCSFIWINPAPNKEGLIEYYSSYRKEEHGVDEKVFQRKKQYTLDRDYILGFINNEKVDILDIGCSDGSFLGTFDNRFNKFGVETDNVAAEIAINRLGDRIYCGDIESYNPIVKMFDLITMRGVIEHVVNPDSLMSKAVDLLKSNGLFYIAATPNVDSFCAEIYRERWNQFNPMAHVLYFSDLTIEKYFNKFGLKLISKEFPYINTPYSDVVNDSKKVLNNFLFGNRKDKIITNHAFWGNMMSLVFRKRDN